LKRVLVWSGTGVLAVVFILAIANGACKKGADTVSVVSSGAVAPSTTGPKVVKPHPLVEGPGDSNATDTVPTTTARDMPLDKKLDPSVVGEYKLEMGTDQMKFIDTSIARLQVEVNSGKEEERQALEMAKAAKKIAMDLVVRLLPGGRYKADLGFGVTGGSYRTGPGVVTMRPDDQTNDPDDPKDMQLRYDKAEKTLTVDFHGETMVLKRRS